MLPQSQNAGQSAASSGQLQEITVTAQSTAVAQGYASSYLSYPALYNPNFFTGQSVIGCVGCGGNPRALSGRQLMGYGAVGGAAVGAATVGGYEAVVEAQVGGAEIAELGMVYGIIGFGDAVAGYSMAGVAVGGAYGMVVGAGVGAIVHGITIMPPTQGPPGMQNFLPY